MQSAQGAQIDDSAVRTAEVRQRLPRDKKWATGIGFKCSVPLLDAEALKCCRRKDSRIVHEQIQPAQFRGYAGDRSTDRGFHPHVALDHDTAAAKRYNFFSGEGGLCARRAIGNGDVRSSFSQRQSDSAANAA